jgi:Ca2+-binding EF-hand superfamily protein
MGEGYIHSIFNHLKKQISKKGPKGFFSMYRSFKCNDFDADGRLSCKEFIKSLNEIRVELLDKETIQVFKTFDEKNSGFISIPEFMSAFIPELNQERQEIVDQLLKNLQGPNGKITYNTIKKVFFARGHPDF